MEDGAAANVGTRPLRLGGEEERDELKDDGWNAAPGSDANWSSLVNNAAENDSNCDFSLFSVVGDNEELHRRDWKQRWSQLEKSVTLSREKQI